MKVRLLAVTTLVMLLLGACGGDDGNGNEDTLLTGLSGVVILALVIYFVMRSRKNR